MGLLSLYGSRSETCCNDVTKERGSFMSANECFVRLGRVLARRSLGATLNSSGAHLDVGPTLSPQTAIWDTYTSKEVLSFIGLKDQSSLPMHVLQTEPDGSSNDFLRGGSVRTHPSLPCLAP